MFRRAMDYLGLGPDDAYDDYDASIAVERPLPRRRPEPRGRMTRQEEEYDDYEEYEDDMADQRAPRAPRGEVTTSSVAERAAAADTATPTESGAN